MPQLFRPVKTKSACIQVRSSLEPVVINANEEWIVTMREHNVGAGGYLVAGATSSTLQQTLDHLRDVRVLFFQGLRPGAFGGYVGAASHEKAAQLDDLIKWICMSDWYKR